MNGIDVNIILKNEKINVLKKEKRKTELKRKVNAF